MNYTKAPWKISNDGESRLIVNDIYLIATVKPCENDLANARLISAAPGLYEALKQLQAMQIVEQEEIISKALAKAEGK